MAVSTAFVRCRANQWTQLCEYRPGRQALIIQLFDGLAVLNTNTSGPMETDEHGTHPPGIFHSTSEGKGPQTFCLSKDDHELVEQAWYAWYIGRETRGGIGLASPTPAANPFNPAKFALGLSGSIGQGSARFQLGLWGIIPTPPPMGGNATCARAQMIAPALTYAWYTPAGIDAWYIIQPSPAPFFRRVTVVTGANAGSVLVMDGDDCGTLSAPTTANFNGSGTYQLSLAGPSLNTKKIFIQFTSDLFNANNGTVLLENF